VAAFIFSGDPIALNTDPDTCDVFGMVFPFGEPVEVEDVIAERLRRHSHFTEVSASMELKPRRGRPPKVRADG
jgi:hypothetical protein